MGSDTDAARGGGSSIGRWAAELVFKALTARAHRQVAELWRPPVEGGSACVTPPAEVLERFELPDDWTFDVVANGEARLRWGKSGRSERDIVLILPGAEEPIEIFGELIRSLRARGAEIYAIDWRHQGKSSRDPVDDQRVNVADFGLYLDDLDRIAAAALDARLASFDGRFTVVGSSMGGHLALRWAARRDDIDRIALISPAIRPFGAPRWLWSLATWSAVRAGRGDEYAVGQGPWDEAESAAFCGGLAASDYEPRAAAWHHLLMRDPGLRVGGPTYNWLRAITRSSREIDKLRPGFTSAQITIFSADRDHYVDNNAHHRFCDRHRANCSVVSLDAKHSAFLERDDVFNVILDGVAGGAGAYTEAA